MTEYLVGPAAEIDSQDRKIVSVDGEEIVVLRHEGRLHALSNTCLHMGGPVGEGVLIGKVESVIEADGTWVGDRFSTESIHLVCPWHGWEYDLETGACAGAGELRLRRFDLVERDGDVYLVR